MPTRPLVVLEAPGDDADMLAEWLLAAGFDAAPHDAIDDEQQRRVVCSLVRWPVVVDLRTLPPPVLLLYQPGADLRPVVGAVSEVVELPDSQDVKSLLEWSTKLNSVLRQVVDAQALRQIEELPEVDEHEVHDVAENAPELIAIGISTGGPASLRELFEALPNDHSLPPIVVVQHIPAGFVDDLVQRLRLQTGYDVRLAAHGERIRRGVAYIAPGDHHLRVVARAAGLVLEWDDAAPIRGHKPAVDVLFASCAQLDVRGVAVIMTGMGRDGAGPMRTLRDRGWQTIGQDEETCTIYGMPRAARQEGAVVRELPLARIAPWLTAYCHRAAARTR
jgi:chemotaxis response regulator CheB